MRWIALFSVLIPVTQAWPDFNDLLPNGHKVPNPCNPSLIWKGIGHLGPHGSGPRNKFGRDFHLSGRNWTKICNLDSDGDGRKNGLELGDPECQWTTTNRQVSLPAFSNPGVCEPWDSTLCLSMNASLDCNADKVSTGCEFINEQGVQRFDMQLNGYKIPSSEWAFTCQIFDLPTDTNYHVIASKPIIDHPTLLSKVAVYGCNTNVRRITKQGVFECNSLVSEPCQDLIAITSNGYDENGNCYPRDVGVQIGKTGYKQVLLKWTFLNPSKLSPTTNSGMSLFMTKTLRKFNAGIAVIEDTHFSIPGRLDRYSVSSACPSGCTREQLLSPVTIVAGINIMQSFGTDQKVEVERKGKVYHSITEDTNYNVFSPKAHWYTTPVPVIPGDMLKLTCSYNTQYVRNSVNWGTAPNQELCKTILIYYPKENWLDPSCESYRNVPLCTLEVGGSVFGCSYNSFMKAVESHAAYRTLITQCSFKGVHCNDFCLHVTIAARKTPCLTADLYDMWKATYPSIPNKDLALLYEALMICEKRYNEEGRFMGTGRAGRGGRG